MEHVWSVLPTGKFPEKVENLKRWSRFPGWNFRTDCRVPLTFLVVCTSSRSTVGHPATYRGLRPNGTTFYRSEIPLLLPPKFPDFFRKWKAPRVFSYPSRRVEERTREWGCVMSMMLRATSVEMRHNTRNFAPSDPKCWVLFRMVRNCRTTLIRQLQRLTVKIKNWQ